MVETLFELFDRDTRDGLALSRDADRLLVTLSIEGLEHTLILTDGERIGERIADALRGAPREPARVPRRVAL